MSNVTLTRITKPHIDYVDGKAYINHNVTTLFVKFTDRNGDNVSLAFDGRFDSERLGGTMNCEHYTTYADCPVQMERDGQRSDVRDRNVMRALRDALNALDLED